MVSTRQLTGFNGKRIAWMGLATTAFIAGSILGPTAATAITKAQEVFVTNDAANPVPVAGTVNVGNLPATQPVSGAVSISGTPTVNIGTVPAPALVSGGATQSGSTAPGTTDSVTLTFPTRVTAAMFYSDQKAEMTIVNTSVANGYRLVSPGGATVTQSFYNPIEAVTFRVTCRAATTCSWEWAIAGI
jgi:hypothetical protein